VSEEDQVRRLLADARHDEPIPPDVATRLDAVLDDLRAARADRPPPAVADLGAARRRRRVRALLVAAAVVVVAGVGIDQLRHLDVDSDSTAGGSSADSATSSREAAGGDRDGLAAQAPESPQDFADAPRLDSDGFARQVARLRSGNADLYATESQAQDGARTDLSAVPQPADCAAPGRGRVVAVRYDGEPGLLVYRPVRGDTQIVDLYLCGRTEPTRSITLPAP